MFKFTKLNDWCLTGTKPAFYDTESATATEQTAKLYGAVKTLIDETEKAINELDQTVIDYKNGIIEDQNDFKNHVDKVMHDYIAMIDDKILTQDKKINETIVYIKENIIDSVQSIINEMKETGELDDAILNSFNGLDTRLNQLEEQNLNSRLNVIENKDLVFNYDETNESLNINLGGVN